jgi:PAS domain S-box-containing protein
VFDAAGVMRFVAWNGLSEQYRAAVDGHSPWSPGEQNATPVLVADAATDAAMAPYRATFAREGIRALAFVPLRFGSKLLGKFMLYYSEPHVFSAEEITIAETVAGHIAFALEHHRIAAELEAKLKLEQELRRSAEHDALLREANERRLHLALAAGRMGAWVWDVPGGRVEWSPELEAIHGLEPGEFRGTIEAFRSDVHPEDAERLETAIRDALARPDADYEIEYRILPPKGGLRWVAARGRVIRDADGRPVRMVGICSDATERRRIEEASGFLAEASRVLATTLDPGGAIKLLARIVVPRLADWCIVHLVDESGNIVPAEVAHRDPERTRLAWSIASRWPGRPEEQQGVRGVVASGEALLVSRIDRELLTSRTRDPNHLRALESLDLHSAVIVPLQARGRVLGALSLISAESQRIYADADVKLTQDIASWAALAIDNAQLYQQAEHARGVAERSRRQLESLAEISDELANALDPMHALKILAGRVVPLFADYCITYSVDGANIRRLGLAHADRAKVRLVEALDDSGPPTLDDPAGVGSSIRGGEPIFAPDITAELLEKGARNSLHLDALRALQPCSAIVVPLRARGRTFGGIALATATTDSARRYDEADFRIAIELANRAALLIDNARLYAEARSAVRARDDMIAVVSHDLRNPLQSIAAARALLDVEGWAERRPRCLDSISVATVQMERLLNDLLDISRMDAGQFSVRCKPLAFSDVLEEAGKMFQPLADDRSVRLVVAAEPDLPFVDADRGRILQVLGNLVGNALKFVGAGGTVTVSAERYGDGIRVIVADTGPGIAAMDLDKVFDRFWRGTHGPERGAGLGLAVAKGIVAAHGGNIGVESRIGVGSTFHFTLRASARASSEHALADRAVLRATATTAASASPAP